VSIRISYRLDARPQAQEHNSLRQEWRQDIRNTKQDIETNKIRMIQIRNKNKMNSLIHKTIQYHLIQIKLQIKT
jgi:hypothetical protein